MATQIEEKVQVSEPECKKEEKEEEKKHEGQLQKLHRPSSSSSDEVEEKVEEGGEMKKIEKKKKGFLKKIKEKLPCYHSKTEKEKEKDKEKKSACHHGTTENGCGVFNCLLRLATTWIDEDLLQQSGESEN